MEWYIFKDGDTVIGYGKTHGQDDGYLSATFATVGYGKYVAKLVSEDEYNTEKQALLSLPCHQRMWATCIKWPPSDCPICDDAPSLHRTLDDISAWDAMNSDLRKHVLLPPVSDQEGEV